MFLVTGLRWLVDPALGASVVDDAPVMDCVGLSSHNWVDIGGLFWPWALMILFALTNGTW